MKTDKNSFFIRIKKRLDTLFFHFTYLDFDAYIPSYRIH